MLDTPPIPTTTPRYPGTSYSCSPECRQVHRACLGCGALDGPDHCHRLREDYCYELVARRGGLVVGSVIIAGSCFQRYVVEQLSDVA